MDASDKRRGRRRGEKASFDAATAGPAGHRHERLERVLFEEVSSLLRDDVRDPALASVELVGAQLSPDYAHVRLSYVASSESPRAVEAALERVTGFLRGRLGDSLDLKRVPQLRFVRVERAANEGEPA